MNRELAKPLPINDFIPLLTIEALRDYLHQALQAKQIPNRAKANPLMDLSLVDPAQMRK